MSDYSPEAVQEAQAVRMARAASTRNWVYTSQTQDPGPPPPDSVPGSFPESPPVEDTLPLSLRPLSSAEDFTYIRHSTVDGYDGSNPVYPFASRRRPLPIPPGTIPSIDSPASTSTATRRRRMPFVGGFISSMKRAISPHGSLLKTRSRSGTGGTFSDSEVPSEVPPLPLYYPTPTVPFPPPALETLPERVTYVEASEMPEPTPFSGHSTLPPDTPTPHRQSTMTSRTRTSHVQTPWARYSNLPAEDELAGAGEASSPPAGDIEATPVQVDPLPTADYAKMGDSSILSETRSPRSRPATFFSTASQTTSTADSIAMFFHRLYHLPWMAPKITEDYHPGEGMPHRRKWNTTSVSWYNSAKDRSSIDLLSNGTSPPTSPITPLKRSHYRPGREKQSRQSRPRTYSTTTPRGSRHHQHHDRESRASTYTPRRSSRIPSRSNTHTSGAQPRYMQQQPMYIIQPPPAVAQPADAGTASPATLTSPLLMVIPSLPTSVPTSGEGARYPLFSPAASTAIPASTT